MTCPMFLWRFVMILIHIDISLLIYRFLVFSQQGDDVFRSVMGRGRTRPAGRYHSWAYGGRSRRCSATKNPTLSAQCKTLPRRSIAGNWFWLGCIGDSGAHLFFIPLSPVYRYFTHVLYCRLREWAAPSILSRSRKSRKASRMRE